MIIVRIFDGLGNQLFQYAYARRLQNKGFEVYLDTNKVYEDSFRKYPNHMRRANKLDYLNIQVPEVNRKDMDRFSYLRRSNIMEKVAYFLASHGMWRHKIWSAMETSEAMNEKLLGRGNYFLNGWFQDEKYFKDIREQLLKELRPKKKIRISRKLRSLLADEELVSVHVRRGDYVKIGNEISLHYYEQAFEKIQKYYSNPKYLFFSDDILWVKEHFANVKNVYFISDYGCFEDYEELMIMSRCQANIIANSTFSWWGAWLNRNPKKIVIAPKKWFDTQKDIVPKEWIRI